MMRLLAILTSLVLSQATDFGLQPINPNNLVCGPNDSINPPDYGSKGKKKKKKGKYGSCTYDCNLTCNSPPTDEFCGCCDSGVSMLVLDAPKATSLTMRIDDSSSGKKKKKKKKSNSVNIGYACCEVEKQLLGKDPVDGRKYFSYSCKNEEINLNGVCTITNPSMITSGKGMEIAYWPLIKDKSKKYCFSNSTMDYACALPYPDVYFANAKDPTETISFHTSCSRSVVDTSSNMGSTAVTVSAAFSTGNPLQVCRDIAGGKCGKSKGGKKSKKSKKGKDKSAESCCVGTVSSMVVQLNVPDNYEEARFQCTSTAHNSDLKFFGCEGFQTWLYPNGNDNPNPIDSQGSNSWAGLNNQGYSTMEASNGNQNMLCMAPSNFVSGQQSSWVTGFNHPSEWMECVLRYKVSPSIEEYVRTIEVSLDRKSVV